MEHGLTGDLQGHFYFGTAYVVWAVWWLADLLRRGGPVVANPLDPRPDAMLARSPVATGTFEMWLKVLAPLIGIAGELRWFRFPPTDASIIIYQHISAYGTVTVSGILDLLTASKRMPPGSDRIGLAFGFLLPAFLFILHGHQLAVSEILHRLLGSILLAVGVLVLVEHVWPAPLVRWARIYLVMLAGTWLFQVGWMLYLAGYDLESEAVVVRAILFFSWHAVIVAVALLGVHSPRWRRA